MHPVDKQVPFDPDSRLIPEVHIRQPDEDGEPQPQTAPHWNDQIQEGFRYEVVGEQRRLDQVYPVTIDPASREARCRCLSKRTFRLLVNRHRHDRKDDQLIHVMGAGLVLTVFATAWGYQTLPAVVVQALSAVATSLFLFTAWHVVSPRLKSWRQAHQSDPAQRTEPVIEPRTINGRPGPIRPVDVRIAALRYLLALEKHRNSPSPTE
jgi:hypothetical protein